METLTLATTARTEFINITERIQEIVSKQEVRDGICVLWIPHTTAGITVNENADPCVVQDILGIMNHIIPFNASYLHREGNSAAHIKSSLVGCEKTLLVEDGKVQLGRWQGIYFCEFDGPRKRQVWVKMVKAS